MEEAPSSVHVRDHVNRVIISDDCGELCWSSPTCLPGLRPGWSGASSAWA